MTSEERDDNYWMGVRDALRMVDSFLRWARKHPKDAKSIDDFLAEGLIAAAKRCESCLGKELGMKYGSDDPEVDEPREIDEPSHFEEPIPDVEPAVEAMADSFPDSDTEEPTFVSADDASRPEMPPVESVSIDEIETPDSDKDTTPSEDLDFEGIKRDFLSDFPLSAPALMEDELEDSKSMASTPEDVMRAVLEEESLGPVEVESEEVMPPKAEDSEVETYDDVLEVLESPPEADESPSPAAVPKRELWSPYDEPPLPEDENDVEIAEDDATSDDSDTSSPAVKAPPPPPPPETDETEEERRRRARRLFFGT
ncbi:MAG: hypothetical protein ACW975_02960 [Candidatus Thorarchaeota archaeon]